jgi:hypothetical protein
MLPTEGEVLEGLRKITGSFSQYSGYYISYTDDIYVD